MMWLLTAWGGVKRVFGAVVAYPWQAALIIALLACLWLYNGRENALATIAKRDATIVQMEAASKIATAAQIELNRQIADKQTQIAKDADNAKTDIIDRGRAYADSVSGQDYCRKADSPAQGGLAASGDVARDTAVILERSDYDILVGNTARLVKVHQWGEELQAAGLGVPVDENVSIPLGRRRCLAG